MLINQLSFYPKLNGVLSSGYREEMANLLASNAQKDQITTCLNVYSSFVDVCVRKSEDPYNGFDIRNSESKLNAHLSALIGFICTEIKSTSVIHYQYKNIFKKVFNEFSSQYDMSVEKIKISDVRLTSDVENSIKLYQSMNINTSLVEYYSGWICEDKDGHSHMLHIANWCDAYGTEFSTQVHAVISNFAKKHKTTTCRASLYKIVNLLNEFTKHCKTKKSLIISLKAENSSIFMEGIFNSMHFKSMIKKNDSESFMTIWTKTVKHFTDCFIDTNFFEEPLKPFLTPDFRTPETRTQTISVGGELNEKEKERWLVDIPLEIKDEEVLDVIHQRLNRDLEHIRIVSKKMFKDIKYRLFRNMEFLNRGRVKPHPSNNIKDKASVGIDHLANSVATFYAHGFGVGSRTTTYVVA